MAIGAIGSTKTYKTVCTRGKIQVITVEPPNNGQVGDEHLSIVQRLSLLRR